MRFLKSILSLALFVLVLTSMVFSAGLKVRVVTSQANIRLKPDLQSAVISKVPLGGVLDVIKKEEDWYHIKLPADERGIVVTGYIHQSTVEVVEETKEISKEEKAEEKKPPEFAPPTTEAREETIDKKKPEFERPAQASRIESTKRRSFRAGLGFSFPSGDWADLFKLGIGLNVGNSFSLVRQRGFDIELLGSLEAHIFLRKAGYTDINWTRFLLSADCRLNLKAEPITFFAQGGLGVYLDVLEIITWWWKEEGSEFRFGPRIGGGIAVKNLEVMAMYHMVEDKMFSIMGSVIIRF